MDADHPEPRDQTRITEQPALTFSTGLIWLIVGGLLTAIALGVLIPEVAAGLPPVGLPLAAAIADVVLYVLMFVARFAVPVTHLRRRLGFLAIGMLAIAAISLGTVIIVAVFSWNG